MAQEVQTRGEMSQPDSLAPGLLLHLLQPEGLQVKGNGLVFQLRVILQDQVAQTLHYRPKVPEETNTRKEGNQRQPLNPSRIE